MALSNATRLVSSPRSQRPGFDYFETFPVWAEAGESAVIQEAEGGSGAHVLQSVYSDNSYVYAKDRVKVILPVCTFVSNSLQLLNNLVVELSNYHGSPWYRDH